MARTPGDLPVEEDTPTGAPGTHDEQRLWLGIRRSTWQLVAYVALAAGVVVGFIQDDRQDDRERREDKVEIQTQLAHDRQEEEDEDFLACLRGNQQRDALRSAITAAYASGQSTGDVTKLPEWLPVVRESPAVAQLLLRLVGPEEVETGDGQDSSAAAVLATVPANRDCPADYPDHTPGIEVRAVLPPSTSPTTAP